MSGDDLPRCPTCGYNKLDAMYHGDHALCTNYGFFELERLVTADHDGQASK